MEFQNRCHRLHQRLVALLDGIDEESGRVDLLFDERSGFAKFFVLWHSTIFGKHIAILPTNMQLRDITGVQNDEQFVIPFLDGEIGNDSLALRLVDRPHKSVRGFLIQVQDFLHRVLELLVRATEALYDLIEMMLRERYEMTLDDLFS